MPKSKTEEKKEKEGVGVETRLTRARARNSKVIRRGFVDAIRGRKSRILARRQ